MAERRGWLKRSLEIQAAMNRPLPASGAAKPAPEEPRRASRIEPTCEVEGELRLEGPLEVHGDFRGRIACGDAVVVGAAGTVQGPIRARRVEIHGSVVGDVEAARDVVLHAGARLHGDVKTPSLVIERGAFFNGRTEMQDPLPRGAEAPRKRPQPAAAAAPPAAGT